MFELFWKNDIYQNYNEYVNVKKKAKKWGKTFGVLGLISAVGISCLFLFADVEITSGMVALVVGFFPLLWFSYAELGKCYAWGWYWDEKNGTRHYHSYNDFGWIYWVPFEIEIPSLWQAIKKTIKKARKR